MYENLLPVGSVVTLKGSPKRVMVIGRIQAMAGRQEVFDYAACYYPEGLLDSDSLIFFNRDQIDLLYFVGFQDPEELQFRAEVLAPLGEIYYNEAGEIVERKPEEAAGSEPDPEPPAVDSDVVETAVFADVDE